MSYRKVPLVSGEFFHIYNRGNSKQEIFLDDKDREHFVKLLYLSNSKKRFSFRDDIVDKKIDAWDFEREDILIAIGAWVLMPNHFHLYITSPKKDFGEEESNISQFMRKLLTAYTKYFNTKYKRVGSLYEGKFKSVHVKNDNQAKYLFSYIHLNPVKLIDSKWKENGINNINLALGYLNTYKWSSYNDYLGIPRQEQKILEVKDFPKYISSIKDFNSEIISWLQYK